MRQPRRSKNASEMISSRDSPMPTLVRPLTIHNRGSPVYYARRISQALTIDLCPNAATSESVSLDPHSSALARRSNQSFR